jgi:hypothetical protein
MADAPMPKNARAREIIRRQRARVRRIRRASAALAASLFVAVFGVVYVHMATGKDPALGASVSQTSTRSATTTPATTTSTTGDDDATVTSTPSASNRSTSSGSNRTALSSAQS